jgi:hypothetical protein
MASFLSSHYCIREWVARSQVSSHIALRGAAQTKLLQDDDMVLFIARTLLITLWFYAVFFLAYLFKTLIAAAPLLLNPHFSLFSQLMLSDGRGRGSWLERESRSPCSLREGTEK